LDEVHNLYLLDGSGYIVLSLDASKEPGKWKNTSYGSFDLKSEQYIDFNFDGQFDVKALMNENEEVLSRYIYYEGVWKQAESSQKYKGKAVSGSDVFTFHKDSGWQLDDTSKSDPNQPKENN
jgi:hypothetical protein